MDNYLNWTFDYRRHQNENCDFYKKLTELLEQVQSGEDNISCFYILPNFHFNHQNPEIKDQNDLIIGKLIIQKEQESQSWLYRIQYSNSTSGEKINIQASMNQDTAMSLRDYRILHHSINGKETTVPQECTFQCNFQSNCSFTSVFAIPELIRKNYEKTTDFSFIDKQGQIYTAQKIRNIGSDILNIKEKRIKITGYCLLGYANPPSYWWMDMQGHLLLVSTPLLTYVAGP